MDFDQHIKGSSGGNVVAVIATLPADLLTPLSVYLKLGADGTDSFFLESVEGGEALARYSFIGFDPYLRVTGNSHRVVVADSKGQENVLNTPLIEFLREHFAQNRLVEKDELPSFVGGAIGVMGFSCAAWFEPVLKHSLRSTGNDAVFMFCRTVVAFDHARQVIKIITLVFADEAAGNKRKLEALIQTAREKNEETVRRLESTYIGLPTEIPTDAANGLVSNFEREDFEAAVRRVKEYIAAGDAYQVVLSQRFERRTTASPVAIYRAMRSLNPSPYMFLINLGGRSLIGASPEMLVRCRGGELEYRPIAGTRPRGTTAEDDVRLAAEMAADQKEVAEHLMLVDLGRNDLGRVAEYGTVEVSGLMSVEKYSHVQHLVTYLSARLRSGLDCFDALAACFPAGTVSGAPKVRAIEIISDLEPTPRGIYSGAVGYFDYSGNMDTCIAIRTIELSDGIAKIQAGAGIVADSDPAAEYQETINKASALIRAIEIAEGRNDRQ